MGKLFGTDGVRGIANSELTPELAFNLGKAGAFVLKKEDERPVVLIGKDTRISGDMLEDAISAGILAIGRKCYKGWRFTDTCNSVFGKVLQSDSRNSNIRFP